MICCDGCGVWQHVECMGLDKNHIPDSYFCELCLPRKVDRSRAKTLQIRKKDKLSPLRGGDNAETTDLSGMSSGVSPGTPPSGQTEDHSDDCQLLFVRSRSNRRVASAVIDHDFSTNGFLDVGMSELSSLPNGLAKKHLNRRLLKTKQKQLLKGLRGRGTSTGLKGKMKDIKEKNQRNLKSPLSSPHLSSGSTPTSPSKSVKVGKPQSRAGLKNGKLTAQRKLLAQGALAKLRSGGTAKGGSHGGKTLHHPQPSRHEDDDEMDDVADGEASHPVGGGVHRRKGQHHHDDRYEETLINQYTPEVQILTLRGNSAAQETLLRRILAMSSARPYRLCEMRESKGLVCTEELEPGYPVAEVRGRFMIMDQFSGNKRRAQPNVLFYSPTGRPLSQQKPGSSRDGGA
ncbi:histone-lysine N-methyltransferase 2E-like, partial [Tropilaelaps mercedesae]